jgi:hypothetical protein
MTPAPGGKEKVSNYHPNKNSYTRSYDNYKKAKSKKAIMKENGPANKCWDDENSMGNRRKAKRQQQREKARARRNHAKEAQK